MNQFAYLLNKLGHCIFKLFIMWDSFCGKCLAHQKVNRMQWIYLKMDEVVNLATVCWAQSSFETASDTWTHCTNGACSWSLIKLFYSIQLIVYCRCLCLLLGQQWWTLEWTDNENRVKPKNENITNSNI